MSLESGPNHIWVNWVNKVLQQEDMDIADAITKVEELILFFEKFREDGFEDLMKEAKSLHIKLVLIQYLQEAL